MKHRFSEVEQDPPAGRSPFDRLGAPTKPGETLLDGVGRRLGLSVGGNRDNDEIIGERGDFRNVQNEKIRGLFLEGRPDSGVDELDGRDRFAQTSRESGDP